MKNETHQSSRQPNSTSSITIPPRRLIGVARALKAAVITAVLFALLGIEVTLRIAPQLGIIGNVAIVWLVWNRLSEVRTATT